VRAEEVPERVRGDEAARVVGAVRVLVRDALEQREPQQRIDRRPAQRGRVRIYSEAAAALPGTKSSPATSAAANA
jgi:hypothetical protein